MIRLTRAQPDGSGLIFASQGYGPLLEREYDAVIDGCKLDPEQVAELVRSRFVEFAPAETARFCCRGRGEGEPLHNGDVLDIELSLVGKCSVRVAHIDRRNLILRTLEHHPEAGRISFSARRDEAGRVLFRIQSRTRANGVMNFVGFLLMGKQMQSRCWINFIGKVAEACGGRVLNAVRVRTRVTDEQPGDCPGGPDEPADHRDEGI